MAKRFTDTGKWKDTWFQDLPMKYKLFWIYLLDECDNAGVWKPNFKLAQFQIGDSIEESEARRIFSSRMTVLDSGYWHIVGFIKFQAGKLNPNSHPHAAIIKTLEKHGISMGLKGTYGTLIDTDKEEDKDKEQEREPFQFGQPGKFRVSIATKYIHDNPIIIHNLQEYFLQQGQLDQLILGGLDKFDEFMADNPAKVFSDADHLYNTFRLFCKNYRPSQRASDQPEKISLADSQKDYFSK